MAYNGRKVNERRPIYVLVVLTRARNWIDQHPRTGWYVCTIVTANFLLDLITRLT